MTNMDAVFSYQKKRSEFGRQCTFSDRGPELIDNYPSNKKFAKDYILKDPVSRETQLAPIYAQHEVNTSRSQFKNSGANHVEGGWPKDVNCLDEEQTKRYRRKIEKEDNFYITMMQLFKSMDGCILQNNAVNIYQEYFSDIQSTPLTEKNSAKTVNVYQDQNSQTRPINRISWSPDNQTKFAVSHCDLTFQARIPRQSTASYIWEVENPNRPLYKINAECQTVCIEYNMKDFNFLASGHTNGQVAFWDLRKGLEPVEMSKKENSFLDPVQNVLWIHSKTNTEFFSSSTDGTIKWWDLRKMSEPTETLILDYAKDKDQCLANALGASALEYEITIPTRYMVGTEEGVLIMGNRKGKTSMEKMAQRVPGAHMGPILTIQRNPQFLKNFLTVGDWSAKLWSEDCRESAIMWTPYQKVALTDGAWSPTKLSCFFTTRADGILDVWDVLQQQKRASLSLKICDEKLTCLRNHELGKLVAVGNQNGTVYLVELSNSFSVSHKNDKMLITAMLERENRREKILEARNREIRLKQKAKQKATDVDKNDDIKGLDSLFSDNAVKQAEVDFYQKLDETKEKNIEEHEMAETRDSNNAVDAQSQSDRLDLKDDVEQAH